MNKRNKIILGSVVVLTAFAAGRYTLPEKIVEKEKIVVKEVIVEKKVLVSDTNKQNDKVYIKLVTIKPDGTRIEETKIVDKGTVTVNSKENTNTDKNTNTETEKTKIVENSKLDLILSAGVKTNTDFQPTYGLLLQKRLLGPVYVGGFGFMDKSFGVSAGLGF